ncbi:MAG TPA: hypothetical protein VMZ30_04960 [Pyrinomonadaceae bacterium]|nr:hypothetical protein [Pyrinomonadaceae bacterium]
MQKTLGSLVATVLLVAANALAAQAQTAVDQSHAVNTPLNASSSAATNISTISPATQAVISSLANLPEADMLIYINPQRILNEALPKFLPAKDIEGMRKGFEEVKKNAGIDPTTVQYLVIAVRFRKPTADLNFQPPEFLVVSSGDFSADSLLTLARMASQGKLRDEPYGGKTMGLMTIDPIAKESEKNPFLKSFTEVAVVSLNANTIAAGTPGYLRSAIDAGDGKGRISTEALASLVRDPNALVSLAGSPWGSFAKSFGMHGTETTARTPRCESKIGDFYAALTMDATNFMIRGVSNADNPDTARILANLYFGLLQFATKSVPDPSARSLLAGIAVTAEGDEVLVRASFPQQMILDLIKQQMKPKQEASSSSAQAKPQVEVPAKPAVKKRRTRRRN